MSGELDLMLQSLNSMRVEGLLTDVILVTSSGLEIPAHKNILAARSRYFYCMFNGGTYFNLLYFELDIDTYTFSAGVDRTSVFKVWPNLFRQMI